MLLKNFLKSQSVFKGLSDRDCEALAHAFEIREYPDGYTIIKEGKPGKELFMLVEGLVKVARYHAVTGLLEEINRVLPGELFGLISLVDHLPASASCISVGPVKVGVLQRSGYDLLSQFSVPIALEFQIATAKQLASVLRHQAETLRSVPQRV